MTATNANTNVQIYITVQYNAQPDSHCCNKQVKIKLRYRQHAYRIGAKNFWNL